ncbi:Tn7 transposase TnsA N-terminal domain-containing protein [Cupriavidus sp. TMH.W2]|uniref:Tn7 transposase TnsA N-terminal domain-containing protein n=1 Tax=Cupriavidus sp. TMH.W2 TaxID=3434465 RepID=UPI003D781CE6
MSKSSPHASLQSRHQPSLTYREPDGVVIRGRLVDPAAPMREIENLHPGRTVGGSFFPGRGTYHAIDESALEALASLAIALAADIHFAATQPLRLTYEWQGRKHRYTPDIYIRRKRGPALVEVKELETLLRYEDLEKHAAKARQLCELHASLVFITDDVFSCGRFLEQNLLKLQTHLRLPPDDSSFSVISHVLRDQSLSIKDVMYAADVSFGEILRLLAHRRLACDWYAELTPRSGISLPGRPFSLFDSSEILNAGEFSDLLEELSLGRIPKDQRRLQLATAPRSVLKIRSRFGNIL